MQKNSQKILIIRLGAIGDVVHTSNTYRAIKALLPNSCIHYLTTKTQACFLENDPDIDKVWIISKDDMKLGKSQKIAKELKKENFDLAINLQPNIKSRLLVFHSGIKKELIYKKSFKQHAVENFFNTAKKHFKDIVLPTTMTLYLSETAKEYAKKEVAQFKRPIIAINAGGIKSPRQGRTYPVDCWTKLEELILTDIGGTIILTGAKEDEEALLPLKINENVYSYIGKTSLEENAALIQQCDLMISGDSGPLHIATALNVPSIGLYGSMPINRTGTYGENCVSIKAELDCIPCNRRKCKYIKKTGKTYTPCMSAISAETIFNHCQKLLKIKA